MKGRKTGAEKDKRQIKISEYPVIKKKIIMTKFMINNACCYDGGGNEDPDAQDCLDKWKEQLEEVCKINIMN